TMTSHPTTPPELKVLAVISSTTPRMPSRTASTALSQPPTLQQSPLTKPQGDGVETSASPLLMPIRRHSPGASRTPTSHPTKRFRSVSSSELALVDCARSALRANRWPNCGLRSTDVSLASAKGRSVLSSTRSTLGRCDAHQSTTGRELNFETVGPRHQYRIPYSEPPRDRHLHVAHSASALIRPIGFHERIQREVDALHSLRVSQCSRRDPSYLDNLARNGLVPGPGAHLTIDGGETTETDSESELVMMGSPLRQIYHPTTPARQRQRQYGKGPAPDLSLYASSRSQPTTRTTSFTGMRRASTSMPTGYYSTISESLNHQTRLPNRLAEERSDRGDTTETDDEMVQLAQPGPLTAEPTLDHIYSHPGFLTERPHSGSGESTASEHDTHFLHPLPAGLSNDPGDSDATDSLDEDIRQSGHELIRRCSGTYRQPSTGQSSIQGGPDLIAPFVKRPPRPPVTAKPARRLQSGPMRRKRPFRDSLDQLVVSGYDTDDEQPTAEYHLKPTPRLSPTRSSLGLTTTRIKRRKSTHFQGDHTSSPTPFTRHRSQSYHPSSDQTAVALGSSSNQTRRRASATDVPPLPPIQRLQPRLLALGPGSSQTLSEAKPGLGSVRSQRRVLSGPPPLVQPSAIAPPAESVVNPTSDSATESDDNVQPLGMAYRRLFQGHGDLPVLDNTGQFIQTIWSPLRPPTTGAAEPPPTAGHPHGLKRPIHSDEPESSGYGLLGGHEDDDSGTVGAVPLPKYRCVSASSAGAKRLVPRPSQPYALSEPGVDHNNRSGSKLEGDDDEATDTESEPEAYLLRARAQLLEKLHAVSTPDKTGASLTSTVTASELDSTAPATDFRALPIEPVPLEQVGSTSSNRQLNFSAETASLGLMAQKPSGRATWAADVCTNRQSQLEPSSPCSQLISAHVGCNSSIFKLPMTSPRPSAANLDVSHQPVVPDHTSTTADQLDPEATLDRLGDQSVSYGSFFHRFQSCLSSNMTTHTLAGSDDTGNDKTATTTDTKRATVPDALNPLLLSQAKGTTAIAAGALGPSGERVSGFQRLDSAMAESNTPRTLPVTPKRSTRHSSTMIIAKRTSPATTTPKTAALLSTSKPTTATLTTAFSPSSQSYPKTYDQFFKATQSPIALMAKLASAATGSNGHPGSARSATADAANAVSNHR
ncbi:hypothetical protein H4R34_005036, partial [Dimargaris verticillata]